LNKTPDSLKIFGGAGVSLLPLRQIRNKIGKLKTNRKHEKDHDDVSADSSYSGIGSMYER
jgi:hypothetical protein